MGFGDYTHLNLALGYCLPRLVPGNLERFRKFPRQVLLGGSPKTKA